VGIVGPQLVATTNARTDVRKILALDFIWDTPFGYFSDHGTELLASRAKAGLQVLLV
jgi:hypothetical protein